MQCIKCKAELPDGALYCPSCGKKQTQTPRKALKRANGTGTVYKFSGRRRRPWVAAKSRVIIGYYETRTAALEALERFSGRNLDERYNMTFAEVFEEWKAEHYRDITDAGRSTYERAYDVFADLHSRRFRDLRTADYQAIIDRHLSKTHSTVSKYKQLLTQMSKWAIREEIITTNYASFVRVPEQSKTEKLIFTDAEIKRIEAAAQTNEAARIVCMLLATGMRIGELFSLPYENYYGEYVIGGSKTEAGRDRYIPIRPEGLSHFEYFAARSGKGKLLLDGYSGNKTIRNFRRRDYADLLRELNIDPAKTPHSTRHTYASRAVREKMEPDILQHILGHTKFETTADIYNHPDNNALLAAVNPDATLLAEKVTDNAQ